MLILIAWVFFVSSRQIERNRRIEEEVAALEQEAKKIQHENETLSEKIAYFSSQDFREQEAKEKLGFQKIGEKVIIIKSQPKDALETKEPEKGVFPDEPVTEKTQFMKWWRLFFEKS